MKKRPMGTRGSSLNSSSSRDSVVDTEVDTEVVIAVDEDDGVEEDRHSLEPSRVVAVGHHNSQARLSVFGVGVLDTWRGLVPHPT